MSWLMVFVDDSGSFDICLYVRLCMAYSEGSFLESEGRVRGASMSSE